VAFSPNGKLLASAGADGAVVMPIVGLVSLPTADQQVDDGV
jgi:hypothetical protein